MRKLFELFVLVLFFLPTSATAQLVSTVAGVIETQGYLDGSALQSLFNNPHGIAVDDNGVVYIADRFGHRIRKLENGLVSTIAGSGTPGRVDGQGTSASFNEPWGIAVTPDGSKIYVADTRNNLIREIDTDGNVITYAGSGNYGTSDGFRASSTFGNPTGIDVGEDGIVYVADHLTHIIRKIDVSGFVTTLAGAAYLPGSSDGPGSSARFYRPYGLSLDNDGNILVADEWNHLIRKVTPDGVVTTIAGTRVVGAKDGLASQATFNYPWDIAVDDLGNIFVADGYNNVIRKIDIISAPESPIVSTYVGTAEATGAVDGEGANARFSGATSIAFSKTTKEFFVGDAYNHLVRKIIDLGRSSLTMQILPDEDVLCSNEPVQIQAIPDTYDTYYFYVNDQIVNSSANAIYVTSDLPEGVNTLKISAEKDGEIINSNEIVLTITSALKPTITVVGDTDFFEGDSVILIANNAESYLWSNGSTDQKITVFDSGSYSVEIIDPNGCSGISDPVEVTVTEIADAPLIRFDGNEGDPTGTFCFGEDGRLESSYESGNQWFKDGWPIEGETGQYLDLTESGIYQVEVTDDNGFKVRSLETTVTFLPQLLDDFKASNLEPNTANPIVNFLPEINSPVDYLWDFGDPNSGDENTSTEEAPRHRYSEVGLYTVSLTVNAGRCEETITKDNYIDFKDGIGPSSSGIFIPTAFTPNGDGINDVFLVRGESVAKVTLYICNKWGELVFQSGTDKVGWDGSMNGRTVQMGNYTYLANVELDNGDTQQFTGHVTVLR